MSDVIAASDESFVNRSVGENWEKPPQIGPGGRSGCCDGRSGAADFMPPV